MTKKVVVTRQIKEEHLKQLKEKFEVFMWDSANDPLPREKFLEEIKDADAALTMLSEKVDKEMFETAQNLKVISNLAVGYDNIDLETAEKNDVTITNTPEVLTETTAELAFTLMLTSARRVIEANRELEAGDWTGWSPYHMAGTDVFGKTIGVFGMGSIGAAFARRLKGFDCKIIYHNRSESKYAADLNAELVSFDELLEQSDFVLCAAPLTDETKYKFDKSAFAKMKSEAHFINIGRGGHVVEADLKEAVETGEIAAAALDVFDGEPISKDHPFIGMDNMTLLPHIGSASVATRDNMVQLCVDNITNVLEGGSPLTQVK